MLHSCLLTKTLVDFQRLNKFGSNQLLAGNYLFDLTLSSRGGGPPCTAGIVPDGNDIISFSVVNSVGVKEHTTTEAVLKITDILVRETNEKRNKLLFYIYDDGKVEKKIILE